MNIKELTFVIVRVLAVYILINGLNKIVELTQFTLPPIYHLIKGQGWGVIAIALLSGIFYIAISVLLWTRTSQMTQYILKDKHATVEPMLGKELYILSFTIVGIVVCIQSVPAFIHVIGQLTYSAKLEIPRSDKFYFDSWITLGSIVLKSLLGLLLIFQGQGVYRLIVKIRGKT